MGENNAAKITFHFHFSHHLTDISCADFADVKVGVAAEVGKSRKEEILRDIRAQKRSHPEARKIEDLVGV